MSLTVNANTTTTFEPVPQGTHLAVCCMLVDLGDQINKTYNKLQRKVLIGWEIPDETYDDKGTQKPKMVFNRYTASLNDGSALRRDLAAWRGRDFTPEELANFDLHNIVGRSCYVNIIHNDYNGRLYANISSIMALPKGTKGQQLAEPALVFDLDTASEDDIENLPEWIQKIVRGSVTYKNRKGEENQTIYSTQFQEVEDDGDLPF